MAMRFRFVPGQIAQPAITLGGQCYRPRPLVGMSVVGPGGTVVRHAVLDTGSDEIILSERLAPALGVDLSQSISQTAAGIGSPQLVVRHAWVHLRLTDGQEFREWPALIGFTSVRLNHIIFGYPHGLQHFTATFDGHHTSVELEVNPLYPGT